MLTGCFDRLTGNDKPTLHTLWHMSQVDVSGTSPLVFGEQVIFATGDGKLISRLATSGAPTWTSTIAQSSIDGSRMVRAGDVVVVPVRYQTVAVDGTNGAVLWRYEAPPDLLDPPLFRPGYLVRTSPATDGQTVFIPAWGASVSALDARTGAVRWIWQTPDTASFRSGAQGVSVIGGTVYVSVWHFLDRVGNSSQAWLVALAAADGRELWRTVLPTPYNGVVTYGAPAVAAEIVAVNVLGDLWAVDRATGAIRWRKEIASNAASLSQAESRDEVIYHDGGDGHVYAHAASTGALVWLSNTNSPLSTDMLVTASRIYYASGPYLDVLDRRSGRRLVRSTVANNRYDAIATGQAVEFRDRIFAGVSDGAWAFRAP